MARTLFLDASWDITLDAAGGIAVVDGPYAVAQNVANAVRLFTDDAYFDADKGIPHFDIELGHKPPLAVLRSRIAKAARAVEGVASAEVELEQPEGRVLGGDIILTTEDGQSLRVAVAV